MENKFKILLVEDEKEIASFIETELICEGYQVSVANDGMQGLLLARKIEPDLIILDRMLPGLDGTELCQRIRETAEIPIIMLTAMGETEDKVSGLDAGANDYLVKPFSLRELLARIRVQLRQKKTVEKNILAFSDLSMDLDTREVRRAEKLISLTFKEFELLKMFLENPRKVMTKDLIFERVWGWDYDGEDNVLEVLIHGLREKIEQKDRPRLIQTIRGVGYTIKLTNEN